MKLPAVRLPGSRIGNYRAIWLTLQICTMLLPLPAAGQEGLYFTGKPYGSEALFAPTTVLINGSYDIIQLENWDRRFTEYPYEEGVRGVLRTLAHPLKTIRAYGWRRFVTSELLPLSTRESGGGQWLPNYQLHLIGEGMKYAALKEWYAYHRIPNRTLLALTTVMVDHLLNETVENGNFSGYSGDVLADLYVFDLGGVLLFSSASVSRFFANTLNLSSWRLQPSVSPLDWTLQNVGQYFSVKWQVPHTDRWHLFYYFGMNNMAGVALGLRREYHLSIGGGLHSRRLRVVDPDVNRKTADLVPTAGVFVDRNNSLLFSLVYSGVHESALVLNLYPGVIGPLGSQIGLWFQLSRDGRPRLGFSSRWVPGLGI